MRGTHKYDRALSEWRNMESAARSYFSKKYLGYYPPEKHGSIVGVGLFEPIFGTRHGQNTADAVVGVDSDSESEVYKLDH
jgi:hypothetical protein